jgi:carboxypeptidase A4
MAASAAATTALRNTNGLSFDYGPICNTIYQASGGSIDSMYELGVKYAFTAELRDTGRYGYTHL